MAVRTVPAGPDGRLGAVQPYLLAETHVTRQLAADPDLARKCVWGLRADQAGHALTVLALAQAHHGDARQIIATALRADLANLAIPAAQVAVQTWAGLGGLLADALKDAPASLEELTRLAAALPYPSVIRAQARPAFPPSPSYLAALLGIIDGLIAKNRLKTLAGGLS